MPNAFIRDIKLIYTLPKKLTGESQIELSFIGIKTESSIVHLSGDLGEASCLSTKTGPVCLVSLKGLHIEAASVEKFLKENSKTLEEYESRRMVAASFHSDPVGILSLEIEPAK